MVLNEIPATLALRVTWVDWTSSKDLEVIVYGEDFFWYWWYSVCMSTYISTLWDEAQVYISYENRGQSFQVRMKNWVACEEWTPGGQMVCFRICLPSVFRKLSEKGSDGPGAGVCEICFHSRQLIRITMQKIIRVSPSALPSLRKAKKVRQVTPPHTWSWCLPGVNR